MTDVNTVTVHRRCFLCGADFVETISAVMNAIVPDQRSACWACWEPVHQAQRAFFDAIKNTCERQVGEISEAEWAAIADLGLLSDQATVSFIRRMNEGLPIPHWEVDVITATAPEGGDYRSGAALITLRQNLCVD